MLSWLACISANNLYLSESKFPYNVAKYKDWGVSEYESHAPLKDPHKLRRWMQPEGKQEQEE